MLAAWPQLRLYPVVALLALAFGFFFAAQLRAELIPPSNRVARNEALARTVKSLEIDNAAYRSRTAALQAQIGRLETESAQRSGASRQLADQVAELRAHSGLTRLHGPGEAVTLGNGQPPKGGAAVSAYLVNFQDVQDVVNLLFRGGAEGIAVNGRRITPESRIVGAGTAVVIDDGPPLVPPFSVAAVGNRAGMETLLAEPASLGDLKQRQRDYQLQLGWAGAGDLVLPAADLGLEPQYAHAG